MDFKELVISRYSCRNFQEKNIPDELINELFETCRYSPSATNAQPWEFIIVNKPDLLQNIHKSYARQWLKSAPVVIIAIADAENAWMRSDGKNHADIDLSIFIDHFTLAATEKNLATCWVCNFDVKQIQNDFSIPHTKEPIALIPLGYPNDKIKPAKKRKQTSEFIYYNNYPND